MLEILRIWEGKLEKMEGDPKNADSYKQGDTVVLTKLTKLVFVFVTNITYNVFYEFIVLLYLN